MSSSFRLPEPLTVGASPGPISFPRTATVSPSIWLLKRAHYWLWDSGGSDAALPYRNDTPPEIVEIFEKHGFIWGGRWFHYDTMHFEYRPELIEPEHPVTGGSLP